MAESPGESHSFAARQPVLANLALREVGRPGDRIAETPIFKAPSQTNRLDLCNVRDDSLSHRYAEATTAAMVCLTVYACPAGSLHPDIARKKKLQSLRCPEGGLAADRGTDALRADRQRRPRDRNPRLQSIVSTGVNEIPPSPVIPANPTPKPQNAGNTAWESFFRDDY